MMSLGLGQRIAMGVGIFTLACAAQAREPGDNKVHGKHVLAERLQKEIQQDWLRLEVSAGAVVVHLEAEAIFAKKDSLWRILGNIAEVQLSPDATEVRIELPSPRSQDKNGWRAQHKRCILRADEVLTFLFDKFGLDPKRTSVASHCEFGGSPTTK
jgi:hypothetical protein